MARYFYLGFLFFQILFSTSCLSMMFPVRYQHRDGYEEAKSAFEKKMADNEETARKIYSTDNSNMGFEKAIEQCQLATNDLFYHRLCYLNVFPKNLNKSMCQTLNKHDLAQYHCYRVLLKRFNINDAEVNKFCPDSMCLAAYISLNPKNKNFSHEQLSSLKMKYMKLSREPGFSVELSNISSMYVEPVFYFHEVVYGGGRTNGSYTLGYDLNLGDSLHPYGIGLGMYDIRNKTKSVDFVISGAKRREISVRVALGTQIQDEKANKYHFMYALGFLGFTPLIEVNSDFKKDHQLNLGVIYMFQFNR